MSARCFVLLALLVSIALAASSWAHAAIVIDGQLEPEYGSPNIVQTLQTGLSSGGMIPGNNTLGDLSFASGSELDAAHALVTDGVLRLFLSGNLALRLNIVHRVTLTGLPRSDVARSKYEAPMSPNALEIRQGASSPFVGESREGAPIGVPPNDG